MATATATANSSSLSVVTPSIATAAMTTNLMWQTTPSPAITAASASHIEIQRLRDRVGDALSRVRSLRLQQNARRISRRAAGAVAATATATVAGSDCVGSILLHSGKREKLDHLRKIANRLAAFSASHRTSGGSDRGTTVVTPVTPIKNKATILDISVDSVPGTPGSAAAAAAAAAANGNNDLALTTDLATLRGINISTGSSPIKHTQYGCRCVNCRYLLSAGRSMYPRGRVAHKATADRMAIKPWEDGGVGSKGGRGSTVDANLEEERFGEEEEEEGDTGLLR